MTLTRDEILAIKDIKIEEVPVPQWGGKIFVKGMTGAERDKFESSIMEYRGNSQRANLVNVRARMASLTICDENGSRLFSETDVLALGEKSAGVLQQIFEVAQRLSGMTKEDVKDLTKELEVPLEDSVSD
jgi:hypothetical protein